MGGTMEVCMRKELKILGGLTAAAAGALALQMGAKQWRQDSLLRLNEGSLRVQTALGPVEYASYGEGEAVLLLHGTPGGYDQGMVAARQLLGRNFQTIAPSRPGYLGTPLRGNRTIEEQADLMVSLMDTLLIDRAAVIGASGGGPVAVQMALNHRERVKCLVLLEAAVQPLHLPVDNLVSGFWAADITGWLMTSLMHAFPGLLLTEECRQDPQAQQLVREMVDTTLPVDARRAGLINDARNFDNLGALPLQEVRTPTLVIHGDQDQNVPYAHAQYAAETIPGAQLVSVPGGTHLTTLVAPQTQQVMAEFLKTCE